jgi:hypothetical protein
MLRVLLELLELLGMEMLGMGLGRLLLGLRLLRLRLLLRVLQTRRRLRRPPRAGGNGRCRLRG